MDISDEIDDYRIHVSHSELFIIYFTISVGEKTNKVLVKSMEYCVGTFLVKSMEY